MKIIKTFIIQTINNQIVHDSTFTLIEAIKYNNWYANKKVYNYYLCDDFNSIHILEDIKKCIPIGSVEFVLKFLAEQHGIKDVKPLNIPKALMKPEYTKRNITTLRELGDVPIDPNKKVFIKSKNRIKGIVDIVLFNDIPMNEDLIISDVVNIDSEWRAFVLNNKLIGLQNYSGDFTWFPDVSLIRNMIDDYRNDGAYTLDVGINEKGTFIIEVHDFFSCGLYGFAEYKLLPSMFISTWNRLVKDS